MTISQRTVGSAVVLRPEGRVDHETAGRFEEVLIAAARIGGVVVLDFGAVSYVSSVGLRAIMMGAKESKASKGSLAVTELQPVVQEIFQISRFHYVVSIFPSLRDALTKLAPDSLPALDQA